MCVDVCSISISIGKCLELCIYQILWEFLKWSRVKIKHWVAFPFKFDEKMSFDDRHFFSVLSSLKNYRIRLTWLYIVKGENKGAWKERGWELLIMPRKSEPEKVGRVIPVSPVCTYNEFLCFVQSCLCCWCQSFEEKQSLEEKQSCLKFKANDHGYDNFRSSNKYSSS